MCSIADVWLILFRVTSIREAEAEARAAEMGTAQKLTVRLFFIPAHVMMGNTPFHINHARLKITYIIRARACQIVAYALIRRVLLLTLGRMGARRKSQKGSGGSNRRRRGNGGRRAATTSDRAETR